MEVAREIREVVHPFQRLSNFRDVGGLKTADGRTFRAGVLFRSDELSCLNAGDLVKLQGLGIELICDLRSPGESQKRRPSLPDESIRVVNVPIHEQATQDGSRRKLLGFLFGRTGGDRFRGFSRDYYHHIAFGQTARFREVITLLSEEQNLPALIHCTAGKDRTGFLAALIQLLVGVPYEMVMEDYLRTNDYFGPRLEKFIKVMAVRDAVPGLAGAHEVGPDGAPRVPERGARHHREAVRRRRDLPQRSLRDRSRRAAEAQGPAPCVSPKGSDEDERASLVRPPAIERGRPQPSPQTPGRMARPKVAARTSAAVTERRSGAPSRTLEHRLGQTSP